MTDQARGKGGRILHLVGWFFPQSVGGSEVYVRSLAQAQIERGLCAEVAVPDFEQPGVNYQHAGLTVHRFPPIGEIKRREGEGAFAIAADTFRHWLKSLNVDVVHMHSVVEGLSRPEVDEIKRLGLPLVVTVHVPGVTCTRGTMLRWGKEPCDGRMLVHRCSACLLQERGLARPIAAAAGLFPTALSRLFEAMKGRIGTALSMTRRIEVRTQDVERMLAKADAVVAVCQWLYDVLLRNGVPESKLSMSRQATDAEVLRERVRRPDGPLRVGYLGRYNRVKGCDLLIRAVKMLPVDRPLRLEMHGPATSNEERRFCDDLKTLADGDPRIDVGGPLDRLETSNFLDSLDVLAVPSTWLETGPIVVLESLARGVPVLGTKRGGIAELVDDDRTGWLIDSLEPRRWADAVLDLVERRDRLPRGWAEHAGLRRWCDVALEMDSVYHGIGAGISSPLITPAFFEGAG